jgi:pimeloyl-ACP methyl ester carboxylesterase
MKVVLLHAFPLDERMWEPQLAALRGHDVTAPNLYRLGGASMDLWATALLREIWDEVVLVGASMGGYCALAFTRVAPERVRGLVLVGSRADADSPERRQDRQATIEAVQEQGPEAAWTKMKTLLTAAADAELEARLEAWALEQRTGDLVDAIRAMRDRPDSTDVVQALEAPLLVVVGTEDALVPVDDAKALAATAVQGEVEVVDGAGHLPSLQRRDAFNELLLGLLERVA